MSRPFTPAWLADEPAATTFLPRAFGDPSARAAAVDRAQPINPAVMDAIRRQEALRPQSAARHANLDALAHGAAAVVTGQQVGLFLGPLYTLHKAASAVVDAAALTRETGRRVVPIFWLQTEDHDFAEVQSTTHLTASGLVTLTVADELAPDARVSLSQRTLGPSVIAAIDGAGLAGAHANEVTALLARYYRPEATWAEAFGNLIAELFADHGLIVFDPRAACCRADVARLAAPVHAFALRERDGIHACLSERERALADAGFTVQIGIRPAALSCYAASEDAPRHRLERSDNQWSTKHLRALEPESALASTPERFTTTALLRPILQDSLLPTAAYVGGPGELAYFAQLPPLYALAGRAMPLAVPRARFTLVTATARRLAEQLGLTTADASRPRAELAERASKIDLGPIEGHYAAMNAALTAGFADLEREAERSGDGGFGKHAKKAAEVINGALDRLLDRSRRMAIESDQTTAERLTRFKSLLFPNEAPQERVLGFAPFAAQVGTRALVDALVANTTPFDGALREVSI